VKLVVFSNFLYADHSYDMLSVNDQVALAEEKKDMKALAAYSPFVMKSNFEGHEIDVSLSEEFRRKAAALEE